MIIILFYYAGKAASPDLAVSPTSLPKASSRSFFESTITGSLAWDPGLPGPMDDCDVHHGVPDAQGEIPTWTNSCSMFPVRHFLPVFSDPT